MINLEEMRKDYCSHSDVLELIDYTNEAHRLAGEAQHRVELHRQTMEREREKHEQSLSDLRAELDEARDLLQREVDAHGVTMAELERVRPVVEAAKVMINQWKQGHADWHAERDLVDAVDALLEKENENE